MRSAISELHDDRDMVGRLVAPATGGADDVGGAGVSGDVGGGPDVVEAAAAIGGFPVLGAIAPPGGELFAERVMLADQIDPAVIAVEQGIERFGFDRGVAHDLEELLVAPDVVLMRGDVEIAADELADLEAVLAEPLLQFLEEIELVPELGVHLGVGLIAAGRDIYRMDGERAAAEIEAG